MPAFQRILQPVALPGQVLRLEPDDTLRRVRSLEQLAQIGPIDFGSITGGGNATDTDGNDEVEVTELEMNQNQLGQYRIDPISHVEIQLNQTGRQEQRLVNSNEVSLITGKTPANLREIYVLTSGVPYFIVNNPHTYDMDHSLVKFQGFKYLLEQGELDEAEVAQQPISVPIDRLEQAVQRTGAVQRPLQQKQAGRSR